MGIAWGIWLALNLWDTANLWLAVLWLGYGCGMASERTLGLVYYVASLPYVWSASASHAAHQGSSP